MNITLRISSVGSSGVVNTPKSMPGRRQRSCRIAYARALPCSADVSLHGYLVVNDLNQNTKRYMPVNSAGMPLTQCFLSPSNFAIFLLVAQAPIMSGWQWFLICCWLDDDILSEMSEGGRARDLVLRNCV